MGLSRRALAAIFAALVLFYGLTLPGNTIEAIDGYDYALAAETIPLANSHDTRSILFHKINRVIYLTGRRWCRVCVPTRCCAGNRSWLRPAPYYSLPVWESWGGLARSSFTSA